MPDTKRAIDPAPDGFLRLCWASSFKPYVKRVKDKPVTRKPGRK